MLEPENSIEVKKDPESPKTSSNELNNNNNNGQLRRSILRSGADTASADRVSLQVSIDPSAHLATPRQSTSQQQERRSSSNRSHSILSFLHGSGGGLGSRHNSIMRIGDIEGHNGSRPYNIIMDFLILCVTGTEIAVVLTLAIEHFLHASGLMAVVMLLPLLLNCAGIIYFLSDKDERLELERSGRVKCLTDFLQFPILGPLFTALKVLRLSCGCSKYDNYERIEAIAVKLRQAGGFFSAAPETLVLLTVLYSIEQKEEKAIYPIQYLEMAAVLLFVFTLAESNCYGTLSHYYKMFTTKDSSSTWRLHHVHLWQKFIVFLHAFTSIASKTIASAALKASALYYWKREEFVMILTVVIFCELGIRVVCHYILRQLKFCVRDHEMPSSCYESLNYAWRATILNFGFQSQNIFNQFAFYVENIACFGVWVYCVWYHADPWVEEVLFIPNSVLFVAVTVLSMLLLLLCSSLKMVKLHGPCSKRTKDMSDDMKIRIIHEFVRSTSVP